MINRLFRVVIPQFADIAVIFSELCIARGAGLSGRLRRLAVHTQHHLGLVPDDGVIRNVVMAETAVEPFAAAVSLEFAASPVMLASQMSFLLKHLRKAKI